MSKSVYEIVTERIIEQLEQNQVPWERPWTGVRSGAFNRVSKKSYSLLNQMILKHDGECASLMNIIGIETNHSFRNSTAYIQSWIKVLKNDVKFIVSASSRAEKAVNYILNADA